MLTPFPPEACDFTWEDEKEYWSGKGHLVFRTVSCDPADRFPSWEIEVEEYSGCIGGLHESVGITYAINQHILDGPKLRLGWTYIYKDITVTFTRGDGWTTDDDADYYVGSYEEVFKLGPWLSAWWWHLVGWRFKK